MWTALEGVTVASRYELRAHLATGGMATVFKGWDHRLSRPVAVKMLRQLETADPSAIERFRREARATAVLQSPHIVEVHDFVEEDGCYYLVMELVDGINLKEYLAQHGPLDAEDAFPIAIQVCRALHAAHTHGFIHRDIKPQNILLDASGLAKLADFGIVHIPRARGFTTSGMVLGTADYISPEQAQGESLAPTTDVYSLGVVLYEMLTALLPYAGTTPISVALQHATAPVPPMRALRPEIPRSVERVVMRAMAKDPLHRYPSARVMALALEQTLAALEQSDAPVEDAEGTVHYAHPVVRPAPADEWRVLAERLRERDAVTAPVAVEPAEDRKAPAGEAKRQRRKMGGSLVEQRLLVLRALARRRLPRRHAVRLAWTVLTAALFLVGVVLLHLIA